MTQLTEVLQNAESASFAMAANANTLRLPAELFEKVLLKLDIPSLLSAQAVNWQWFNFITGSTKLQQKLFNVPVETIEQVVNLGLIQPEDIVLVDDKFHELLAVLNTNVVECTVSPRGLTHYSSGPIKLASNVLPYTISANRGASSWESMFLYQPPKPLWRRRLDTFAVMGCDVGPRTLQSEVRPEPGAMVQSEAYVDGTMRSILDDVEKDAQLCYGYTVDWRSSELFLGTFAMKYCDYLAVSG